MLDTSVQLELLWDFANEWSKRSNTFQTTMEIGEHWEFLDHKIDVYCL